MTVCVISRCRMTVTVTNEYEWSNIPQCVEAIVVPDDSCNEDYFRGIDLSRFPNLQELSIGAYCFKYVTRLRIVGLTKLEKVTIEAYSFSEEDGYLRDYKPNNCFIVKDCPSLRELRTGNYSFIDYSSCIIENLPSLERLEIGWLSPYRGTMHGCFWYASLELRSTNGSSLTHIDLRRLRILNIGRDAFYRCASVAIGGMSDHDTLWEQTYRNWCQWNGEKAPYHLETMQQLL